MTATDRFRALASKLLSRNRQSMSVIKRVNASVYDPDTGSLTPDETTYTGKGVILNYTDSYLHYGGRVSGTSSVQIGDRRVLFTPDDLTMPMPVASVDVIVINMVEWLVAGVSPINPAGDTILYDFQVRRE